MQIASVTGFFGITFVVSLFASAVAYAFVFNQNKKAFLWSSAVSVIIILLCLGYGWARIYSIRTEASDHVQVGLAAINVPAAEAHDPKLASNFVSQYQPLIQNLAQEKASIILLPEKALTLNPTNQSQIMNQLSALALDNHVVLIVGVSEFKNGEHFNTAWLFNTQGALIGEYHKHHLVPGFESDMTAGTKLLNFPIDPDKAGVEICRDMDYIHPALEYGTEQSGILFVPAEDFNIDAFVHNQDAFIHGIENGYTVVRNARSGLLSVTSASGEILGQALNITAGQSSTLLVNAPISTKNSFYSRHPYGFIGLLSFLLMGLIGQILLGRFFFKNQISKSSYSTQ